MMTGHRQCDTKHQIDAYLMVKVWTYDIDTAASSPACRSGDAKTVEPWLKLAVRAATCIAEGGRTHRDHQRSGQPRWDNPMSKVLIRRC